MIEWSRIFPPATLLQIQRFENDTGLTLPASYQQYLLRENGGYSSIKVIFSVPECEQHVRLGCLFGLSDELNKLNLRVNFDLFVSDIPKGFLSIGDDPGGNQLLLATDGLEIHKIFFWDRVGFFAKSWGKNLFTVADNFERFLESLTT